MKNLAHEETYKGCKIELIYEDDPGSPREWDNVGTMVCWHRRYNLGDTQPRCSPDDYVRQQIVASTWQAEKDRREAEIRAKHPRPDLCGTEEEREEVEDALNDALDEIESAMEESSTLCWELFEQDHITLALYLYDHSGITISTGKFSCPWDSGRVGFIYCSKERARAEWGEKYNPGITDEALFKKAAEYLDGEVETYDAYLTGQVVGFVVEDPEGKEVASCWGFYPDEKGDWPDAIEQAKGEIDAWVAEQEREAAERAFWEARDVETVTV
jgi:hypothetical protein